MTWFDEVLAIIEKKYGAERAMLLREQGLPTVKTEGWQHAGLRQFFAVPRRVLETDTNRPSTIPASTEDRIVLWNGRYMPEYSQLPEGVTIESAEPRLEEGAINIFALIAAALAPYIQVHIKQRLHRPLRVESYVEGVLPSFISTHVGITADPEVQAELLLQTKVLGTDPGHLLCSTMFIEAISADLTLTDAPSMPVTALRSEAAWVIAPHGKYTRFMMGNGMGLSHTHLRTNMHHQTSARLHGLYLQKQDISAVRSEVIHMGHTSESAQIFRSSVMDGGRTSFDVSTEVQHDATDTKAVQESRHMLLGAGARAFTIPRLIINTDAVECRHGATVGHADKQQLDYMHARGIGEQRARSLLAYGHLSALLTEYPQTVRSQVDATLRSHLLLS